MGLRMDTRTHTCFFAFQVEYSALLSCRHRDCAQMHWKFLFRLFLCRRNDSHKIQRGRIWWGNISMSQAAIPPIKIWICIYLKCQPNNKFRTYIWAALMSKDPTLEAIPLYWNILLLGWGWCHYQVRRLEKNRIENHTSGRRNAARCWFLKRFSCT